MISGLLLQKTGRNYAWWVLTWLQCRNLSLINEFWFWYPIKSPTQTRIRKRPAILTYVLIMQSKKTCFISKSKQYFGTWPQRKFLRSTEATKRKCRKTVQIAFSYKAKLLLEVTFFIVIFTLPGVLRYTGPKWQRSTW